MTSRTLKEELCNIRGEIKQAAQTVGAVVYELSYEETTLKRIALMTKFAGSDDWTFPWQHLNYPNIATYRDINGNAYQLITDFVKYSKVFMLFNKDDERAGFEFNNGADIVPILDICLSFEFYLTNQEIDYFICYNHHDYLITSGTAADWLKSLLNENGELIEPIS
jgi:hypothetical protein